MKQTFTLLFLLLFTCQKGFSQASVGYYPWNGLITVSTNPSKVLWLDTRVQTNSLFSSLSIDFVPLINFSRGEIAQWYFGGGVRINPLYKIADPKAKVITLDGYSFNIGTRIAPIASHRNFKIALELAPYVKDQLDGGVLRSNFGLVYQFSKKRKD